MASGSTRELAALFLSLVTSMAVLVMVFVLLVVVPVLMCFVMGVLR